MVHSSQRTQTLANLPWVLLVKKHSLWLLILLTLCPQPQGTPLFVQLVGSLMPPSWQALVHTVPLIRKLLCLFPESAYERVAAPILYARHICSLVISPQ